MAGNSKLLNLLADKGGGAGAAAAPSTSARGQLEELVKSNNEVVTSAKALIKEIEASTKRVNEAIEDL